MSKDVFRGRNPIENIRNVVVKCGNITENTRYNIVKYRNTIKKMRNDI